MLRHTSNNNAHRYLSSTLVLLDNPTELKPLHWISPVARRQVERRELSRAVFLSKSSSLSTSFFFLLSSSSSLSKQEECNTQLAVKFVILLCRRGGRTKGKGSGHPDKGNIGWASLIGYQLALRTFWITIISVVFWSVQEYTTVGL